MGILDGDEELTTAGNLAAFFEAPKADGVAVWVETKTAAGIEEGFYAIRAFNRQKGRWKYPIHNQLVGLGPCDISSARIVAHYDDTHTKDTQGRRLQVLLSALEANPKEPHHLYFAAKTHRLLGETRLCESMCDRYLALENCKGNPDRATVSVWKVECLLQRGDVEKAELFLSRALKLHPAYPDLHFYQFLLATKSWYESVATPNPSYFREPMMSLSHARKLPKLVKELGLPLDFAHSMDAGSPHT